MQQGPLVLQRERKREKPYSVCLLVVVVAVCADMSEFPVSSDEIIDLIARPFV